ncbi:MAG: hypothetical protein JWN10_2085 [Solirubrobacterales bacterium]|nr:hypothetical protein [Solirubrobacterales bacterium]
MWQPGGSDLDEVLGKIAWFNIGTWDEGDAHPWCETPRHVGKEMRSRYVVVLTEVEDGSPVVMATCRECTEMFARDLHITVEEGVLQ